MGVYYADQHRGQSRRALVMDLNAEAGHTYNGEYSGRSWVSHPVLKKTNVGFWDGSVRDFPIAGVQLKHPGSEFEELQWFASAFQR
jgi:prepilin-type processing-associated H-X9-DG protein